MADVTFSASASAGASGVDVVLSSRSSTTGLV